MRIIARMLTWLKFQLRPFRPLWLAVRRLIAHDGIEIAGFIAYTGLVSLFPFVIFLFALAGFTGDTSTAEYVMNAAFEQLPNEVARTLSPIVREIFTSEQPGLMTIGIVGTLWVTSSGIEALRMGVARSWEIKETRPLWRRRLTAFAYVAIGAFSALSATSIIVIAPLLLQYLQTLVVIPALFVIVATILRLICAAALLALTLAILYRYLPARTIAWKRVWPGAWLASILWIILASLFSYYLSQSGDYSVTYGSLGGVVITLLFLHFSAIIFLLGVEYSAVVAYRRTATSEKIASARRAD